jgi:hypothetical protein
LEIKSLLNEIVTDLRTAQHRDVVQGVDQTARAQSYDRLIGKVSNALTVLEAEEAAEQ